MLSVLIATLAVASGHLSDEFFLDIAVDLNPHTGSFGYRAVRSVEPVEAIQPVRPVRSAEGSAEDPCPLSGPTTGVGGECCCVEVRGMTLDNDVCACNGTENFEWNESEGACVCASGTQENKHGGCGVNSQVWKQPWLGCNLKRKRRKRRLTEFTCTPKSGATKAPWVECSKDSSATKEECNTSETVCNDWNSEYDIATGICQCKSGYTANKWGCTRTWTDKTVPMSDWKTQVQNRVNAVFGATTWPKLSVKRRDRIYKRLGLLADLVNKKFNSGKKCGIPSRAGNVNFQKDIETLYDDFATYSGMTDDTTALTNLLQWLNRFMKTTIWNCKNSGFGSDPTDGSTDANGAVCTPANQGKLYKCKLQLQLAQNYKSASGIDLF